MYLRRFRQKGREYIYILRSKRQGKEVKQGRIATVTGMCGLFDQENKRYLFFHPLPCRATTCVHCPLESVPHPQTNERKPSLAERLRDLPRFQRDTWLPHCYRRRGTIREEGGVRSWRLSSTDPAVGGPRPG